MTQINSNIDKYGINQQGIMGQLQYSQAPRIPSYYNAPDISTRTAKEVLEENLAYQMIIKPFVEHPLGILGTWLSIGVGLDAYSAACRGKYEDSLLKKAANFGDKIQESKIIQSKPAQAIGGIIGKAKKLGAKAINNSGILRAMKSTPTRPEWEMCKTQAFNHKQEVVLDFNRITDTLKLNSEGVIEFKHLGLDKFEEDFLKKTYNVEKLSQLPQEEAANHILLKRLGKTPKQIKEILSKGAGATEATKKEILSTFELSAEKIKLIKEDVYGKYIDDVMVATGKAGNKVRIGGGDYSAKIGKYLTKPFQRITSCDEIHNKLYSMAGGAKTATGRFTAKFMQMLHRGCTWGQGKLAALIFISPMLVELAVNVGKADKDQKVGTAAHGFVENISWIFTFPAAFKIMHSLGGIKYAGMTKEQVEKYRKIKTDFNEKAGSGLTDHIKAIFGGEKIKPSQFKTKAEYNKALHEAKAELKKVSKVKGQNIFTRALRKIAGFMTLDLENFKGWNGGNAASKFWHGLPHLGKDFIGIPMRFGIWSAISMGVLGAILTKCVTTVFGKSYDAMKQDEIKENKKQQKQFLKNDLKERIYAEAKKNTSSSNTNISNRNMITTKGLPKSQSTKNSTHIIVPMDENVDNYTYIPSQTNKISSKSELQKTDKYSYIPSSECKIPGNKITEKQRRYIPSQAAAKINKTFDNSGLQDVLNKADKAEAQALKILSGNFEGM